MSPDRRFDDAVVGAGILGLAHAYHLARRGRQVVVLERGDRAQGASIRNFGMLWPVGQPAGELRALAIRSLEIWTEVLASAGLWHEQTGSLHLAYHDDEARVLSEFVDLASKTGLACEIFDPAAVVARSPSVRRDGLKLGMWSPSEICVDPREVVCGLPGWLAREHGVRFAFRHPVVGYDRPVVRTASGDWQADRLWVCAGDDFETLYPQTFRDSGLVRCKLQMMRSEPLASGHHIGPMLAAGSTLRHYASFRSCPSLAEVEARFSAEQPEFDRFGIHVMASQNGRGEVVIGDSHEYGDAIEPFDKTEIDTLILGYLRTFLDIPGLRIAARWHGTYAKNRDGACHVAEPERGVIAVTGVGGAGMTFSFGLAERVVREQLGEG